MLLPFVLSSSQVDTAAASYSHTSAGHRAGSLVLPSPRCGSLQPAGHGVATSCSRCSPAKVWIVLWPRLRCPVFPTTWDLLLATKQVNAGTTFSLTVLQDPLLHPLGLYTVVDSNPWHVHLSHPAGPHATAAALTEHLMSSETAGLGPFGSMSARWNRSPSWLLC